MNYLPVFGVASLLLLTGLVSADESSGNFTKDTSKKYELGIYKEGKEEPPTDKAVKTWTKYVYDFVSCDPGKGWSAWCDSDRNDSGPLIIEASPEWQACRFVASEDTLNGSAGWSATKDRIVPNDTQQPSRFRAYHLRVWAYYQNNNVTSKVVLKKVGIKMIPYSATVTDRASENCDL